MSSKKLKKVVKATKQKEMFKQWEKPRKTFKGRNHQ